VGVEVDPVSGGFDASPFDFSLAFTDTVAETLTSQASAAEYRLAAERSASASTVSIEDLDGTAVTTLSDTVIWLGDEAILLGTYNSGSDFYPATRGFYSSVAQYHASGELIYTKPQSIRYRNLNLVLYDENSGTESIIWRGFVDDLMTNDEGTTLEVQGIELYGVLQRARVFRGSPNLARQPDLDGIGRFRRLRDGALGVLVFKTIADGSQVFKSGEADPFISLQFEDEIIAYAKYDLSADAFFASFGRFSRTFSGNVEEFDNERFQTEPYEEIYELLVIDYGEDASLINDDGTAKAAMVTDGVSATRELEYPFHPLAIALAFMLSSTNTTATQADYDVLNGASSMQLPKEYVDVTSFETLIARYPDYRVERMVLGFDGEEFNIWETIRDYCLRPFGFFLGVSDGGKLNAGVLNTNFGIGDFYLSEQPKPIPPMLKYLASRQDGVDEVVGKIGQTPWEDDATLTVRGPALSNKNSVRNRLFADKRVQEYIIPYGPRRTGVNEAAGAFALLEARATAGAYQIPRMVLKFADPDIGGFDFSIGKIISPKDLEVEEAWIINSAGSRVAIEADRVLALTGLIIGRDVDVETLTYTLTLLLQGRATGEIIQWRAPAAVVAASSTTTVINVEQNAFHAASNDTSFFTVGDEIYLFDQTGDYRDGDSANVISAITATSITVSGAFAVTPAAGDIVRLAPYDGYANSGVVTGAGDNVYFYLSEDGSNLGAADEDPHKYG
jgi:hypothetical protein